MYSVHPKVGPCVKRVLGKHVYKPQILGVWWATDRIGGFRTNLRGTYFSKWPISGRAGTFVGDAHQIWDWYAAKPIRDRFELYFALGNLLDSVDPNLGGDRPTLFRADFGRTIRGGIRWNIGAE